jgi:hypothetical protein
MERLTSVEWLVEKLKSKGHALITSEGVFINVPDELFLEAKAIEKEQIQKAFVDGEGGYNPDNGNIERMANDYYNKTYNK